jgi:hypothetical protein
LLSDNLLDSIFDIAHDVLNTPKLVRHCACTTGILQAFAASKTLFTLFIPLDKDLQPM